MSDYIAAQDQMIAAVSEVIADHPQQLVVAWDRGVDHPQRLGLMIFAQGEFVAAAIQTLAEQLFFTEPTVDPPE